MANRQQKQLREQFGELIAPYVRAGAEDALRAALHHKEGRRFADWVCHGDLTKFLALREVPQIPAAATPCLCGTLTRAVTTWAEADKDMAWNDSGLAIAADGSWLAIKQELAPLRFFAPAGVEV